MGGFYRDSLLKTQFVSNLLDEVNSNKGKMISEKQADFDISVENFIYCCRIKTFRYCSKAKQTSFHILYLFAYKPRP